MTGLDEEEAELLAEARRAFTPERRLADRVHAAVLAGAAVPDLHLGQAPASGAPAVGAAGGGNALGALHGLGAWGAKTWFVATFVLGSASAGGLWALSAQQSPAPARSPAARGDSRARARTVASPSKPADAPTLAASSPSEAAPPALPAASSPAKAEPTAPERAAPPAGTEAPALALRDELERVREAERALNGGDPVQALAVLEGLQRFRGGSLREERAALRVLASCGLGTSASGEQARRFLRAYPQSFYAARIREACGASE